MIRRDLAEQLNRVSKRFPVVTVTGPRQSGKTTLCRAVFGEHPYVSLEAPDIRAFAIEDPRGFLSQYPDGAIIDEVQRVPDLLSYLQGIVDDSPHGEAKWILTGSQNLSLLSSICQSLAGRTAIFNLLPLTRPEVTRFSQYPQTLDEAMFSGSYPRIFDLGLNPSDWLSAYVSTYIERDVRMVKNVGNLARFQRFVELCAGRTGQLLNLSSLSADAGVSQPTAKTWMSVLEAGFIAFRLPSYSGNLRKRLVRMPKIHFYDTGLVCWLLGIRSPEQLRSHPLRGQIFETWVVSELVKKQMNLGETTRWLTFYRDRNGAEVDLLIENPPHMKLIEAKTTSTLSSNLSSGVSRVLGHFQESSYQCSAIVVYGGDQIQNRKNAVIIPWRETHTV